MSTTPLPVGGSQVRARSPLPPQHEGFRWDGNRTSFGMRRPGCDVGSPTLDIPKSRVIAIHGEPAWGRENGLHDLVWS